VITTPALLKAIAALGVALMLSLGGNAWQLYRSGAAHERVKGALEVAQRDGRIAVLEQAASTSDRLAAAAKEHHDVILSDLSAIVERGRQERVVYRQAAAAAPLPVSCVPGQGRMDAVNASLGARP
jgi:gamma-glutamyl:cysteine ligase YbdK (ATP-grasp superfamily)